MESGEGEWGRKWVERKGRWEWKKGEGREGRETGKKKRDGKKEGTWG